MTKAKALFAELKRRKYARIDKMKAQRKAHLAAHKHKKDNK